MLVYWSSSELKEFAKLWIITSDVSNHSQSSIGLMNIKVHGNFHVPCA